METTLAAPTEQSSRPIAPLWHTALVLVFMLGISALGALTGASPLRSHGRVVNYLNVMAFQWVGVGLVWLGIRRRNVQLRDLIGASWPKWTAILRDLGIALLFLVVSNMILGILQHVLKTVPTERMNSFLPKTPLEIAFWLALCATAGFCEEVIYRGYLQKQFAVLTTSATAGILIQGIVFGASHGYQGPKYMLTIAVYGCLFGLLAQWQRSLRPGMLAHFLQDGITGVGARYFMH